MLWILLLIDQRFFIDRRRRMRSITLMSYCDWHDIHNGFSGWMSWGTEDFYKRNIPWSEWVTYLCTKYNFNSSYNLQKLFDKIKCKAWKLNGNQSLGAISNKDVLNAKFPININICFIEIRLCRSFTNTIIL